MITNIHIQNFKSLADISISLSNLNVITGINGMGKSSLIQTLLLLRQSYLHDGFRRGVYLNGNLTDKLGQFSDIMYRNAKNDIILFQIEESEKTLAWHFKKTDIDDMLQGVIPDVTSIKSSLFSESKCQYISAGRVTPSSIFRKSDWELKYKQFGKDGEYAIQYISEKGEEQSPLFTDTLNNEPLHLTGQVNYWLKRITPNVALDIRRKSSKEYDLYYKFFAHEEGFVSYSAINSAFGLTFALPIITSLLAAEKGDLLILENPESDLHPQAQSLIGQLMARAAAAGVQIIVETHSDHILNGICVAIHKGLLNNELAKVYYFHKQANEQHTTAYQVPIKENGQRNIKALRLAGIEGFFDQANKDLETILGFHKQNT